jgi:hypothetical protein
MTKISNTQAFVVSWILQIHILMNSTLHQHLGKIRPQKERRIPTEALRLL